MNLSLTMRACATRRTLSAAPLIGRSRGIALVTALAISFAWLGLHILAVPPAYAAFEDLGAGARGPGMGNAMAPVADDVYASHYNPAGLGVMSRPQFTAAYTQLFSGLTDGSKLGTSFFGYAHPVAEGRRGTVSCAYNSFSLDSVLYSENTLYLSYGRLAYTHPRGGELFLGATLKYLSSSFGRFAESAEATNGIISSGRSDPLLQGNSDHNAFDADIGALYRFRNHYQLGLQVTHLPQPNMAFGPGKADPLPMAVKLGLNYKSLISNLVAQAETKKAPDGSTDNILTVAAERWFPRAFIGDFAVRGSMGLGTREYKQLGAGLSYRTRRLQVDYGFTLPLGTIADTSGNHRMSITFHFGKPTEQEETLEMLMATMRALKTKTPAKIEVSAAAVLTAPELSGAERAIAEKLARSEEAVKAGRYREAVSLTSAVTAAAPGTAAAWQNMGIAYLGLEKYKSSLFAWEKAYDLEKSPALKQAIRGYIKSITRLERSKTHPKPAPKNVPATQGPSLPRQEIESLLNSGADHYVNGEADKAREIFEKVLQADPDNVEALKALRRIKDEKAP